MQNVSALTLTRKNSDFFFFFKSFMTNILVSYKDIHLKYYLYQLLAYNFSKHNPSGPILSINRNVRLCVCLSVRLCVCSLLRYSLTVSLPPFPEVGCPIFLEIRNPLGKVMERSGLTFGHFCLEMVKNRRAKKSFFCCC